MQKPFHFTKNMEHNASHRLLAVGSETEDGGIIQAINTISLLSKFIVITGVASYPDKAGESNEEPKASDT